MHRRHRDPAPLVDQRRDPEADRADLAAAAARASSTASTTRRAPPSGRRRRERGRGGGRRVGVDHAGQELRAAEVDADHAGRRHARPPYPARDGPHDPPRGPEATPDEPPATRTTAPGRGSLARPRGAATALQALRGARRPEHPRPPAAARRPRRASRPAGACRRGAAAGHAASRPAASCAGCSLAIVGWIGALARAVPGQRADPAGKISGGRARARRRRAAVRGDQRPGPRLRRAHRRARRSRARHGGPEPLGHRSC